MNGKMINLLASGLNLPVDSLSLQKVSGPSNQGVYFFTADGKDLVVKSFVGEKAGLQMQAECEGLRELREACSIIRVPKVHTETISGENSAFYVMDRVNQTRSQDKWEEIGLGLAELHSKRREWHGLDYSNFIVSITQLNTDKQSWPQFFRENRILPLLALTESALGSVTARNLEKLALCFEELLPDEQPSLLHGDLWAGNCLVSEREAWLIDPAIYYGSREMDMAMTRLFGGFDPRMIEVYQHHFPMEAGWEERFDLCNLYPLLVHVNLFGASYVNQVAQIVSKYTL